MALPSEDAAFATDAAGMMAARTPQRWVCLESHSWNCGYFLPEEGSRHEQIRDYYHIWTRNSVLVIRGLSDFCLYDFGVILGGENARNSVISLIQVNLARGALAWGGVIEGYVY